MPSHKRAQRVKVNDAYSSWKIIFFWFFTRIHTCSFIIQHPVMQPVLLFGKLKTVQAIQMILQFMLLNLVE